jgi:LAS superfamily LD-carboxypeptidase LdcB
MKRLSEAVVNDKNFKINGKTIDKSDKVSDETKDAVKKTNSKEKDDVKSAKPTDFAPIANIDFHDENNLPTQGDIVNKINPDDGSLVPSSYKELQDNKDKEEKDDDSYYEQLSNNQIPTKNDNLSTNNTTNNTIDDSYYDSNIDTKTDSFGTYYSNNNSSNSETSSKPYNKPINIPQPQPDKVNIWFQGTLLGQEDYIILKPEFCNGVKIQVVKKYFEPLMKMLLAAKQDGVILKLNDGYRSYEKQLDIRRRFLKDNYKSDYEVNNDEFLASTKASPQSTYFKPLVAPPGYGFHHYGISFDIQCKAGGLQPNDSYKWLLKNAFTYGFVRTVPSEDWHWEYKPWNELKIKNFYKLSPPYTPYSIVPNNDNGWFWGLKPIEKQSMT